MAFIKVDRENSTDIHLYYEDHGSGAPVVLIHGWPLSSQSWEKQVPELLKAGFRVITYDRRGFGKSSQPSTGYDDVRLSEDLHALMTQLDLRGATLVGFSMAGSEIARYLDRFGSDRVDKAVFISAVTPFLIKTDDNPEGVEAAVFQSIRENLMTDRPKFLAEFFKDFYNVGLFDKISAEALHLSWIVASLASPLGTLKAVEAWLPDFREALGQLQIPVLVIHGDADKTVPIASAGARMPEILSNCEYKEIKGGPHGILWTHAEEVNAALLDFLMEAGATERNAREPKVQRMAKPITTELQH